MNPTRQLYIDGESSGPSYGPGLPGPKLPHKYTYSAEIRNEGDHVLAEVAKTQQGREKYRRINSDHTWTPWVWRDTIRDNENGYLRIADRCDGKGTIGIY